MTPEQINIEFATLIKGFNWDELIEAHKFYNCESENKQAYNNCILIERELTIRALKDTEHLVK